MQFLKKFVMAGTIAFSALNCSADPGVSDSSITIGMSAPFSGPNGAYGLDMRQTIQNYFDQVNKSGGVFGRKLELVALDDGYETDRTVNNTKILLNEKNAFALLAFYGSSPTTETMNTVFGPAKVPAGRHDFRGRHPARADQRQPQFALHVQCARQLRR